MKILFLVHNLGKTRHFERVIVSLAERGHSVVLGAARKRQKPLKLTAVFAANPRIDAMPFPVARVDAWKDLVRPLRQARDYLRFLTPEYADARKLAQRAGHYAPPGWAAELQRRPWLLRNRRWLQRTLELAEALIPSERFYELSILAEQPDVILVTPLVDFGSYQTDYVKSAHRLGIPVVFMPFSWDNLTNRGLIRVQPDRVLVWNEHQKREAIDLHGVAADRVVITGAARFDEFFEMQPASTREAFCSAAGLDPACPLLLYLCSSKFVAPAEVPFVQRWIEAVRASSDCRLRGANVLVRPHPANLEQWEGVTLADAGAAVWQGHEQMQADQSLYDSLFHCSAVVGLNTSAMIEAGIVGRPVYTLETPEFAGGQEQTLHFHYLLSKNGGLVEVATTLTDHLAQVAGGLRDPSQAITRNRRFVEAFVRPRGADKPVAPIMVKEIERAARLRKRRHGAGTWMWPARRGLLALLTRRAGRARR